jgi:hypothetical protein
VTIEPSDVVSVLATATLFQLEGLISQCLGKKRSSISRPLGKHFSGVGNQPAPRKVFIKISIMLLKLNPSKCNVKT